ncbi:MAG: hypothetical protein CVV09_13685 [Gammaproteobacteria bacterium HGW-Gammaproteobacteria-13]|nr:MAG: hypothetical protein CVV09_13685 [Gammaproteobacteria bacterium HGW-Gammaproteobacteria-13]
MTRLIALLVGLTALAGCTSQPPVSEPPIAMVVASDPQRCDSRVECTTKTSRTLLFVFDYAAAGAPLVQRDGRLLFTPADAPVTDWPALYIRLAEAEQSAFAFNAQLLQIYRSYLRGQSCDFHVDARSCVDQAQ